MNPCYISLNKVLAYIDNHPAGDLSLAALAQVSGYSPYHFHRMFHAMTGRTLHDYVLCRRVNVAAGRLLYEKATITEIALDCGFASPAGFTRSFRQYMHCSPSAYRKHKKRKRPMDAAESLKMYNRSSETDALFSLAVLPDIHAAGIAARGLSERFESKLIEAAFHVLFAWVEKTGMPTDQMQVMGITLDTPEVVPLGQCRYFACVSVDEVCRPEGEISVRSFPTQGEYVRFSLVRTRPDFSQTFTQITDYLYGCYMPAIGCYPDNRFFLEIYRKSGADVHMDFYVPIRRRGNAVQSRKK